jgi:hypothetical protein
MSFQTTPDRWINMRFEPVVPMPLDLPSDRLLWLAPPVRLTCAVDQAWRLHG